MSDFKIHSTKDMYKAYVRENPGTDVTYPLFKYIISEFNKRASNKVLEGRTLNLGNRLGNIRIKKIIRNNFSKPAIDFGETRKLKSQGIDKVVYFTDNFYFRWYWQKVSCNIPNKSVYRFVPSGGLGGNRRALVKLLKNDEFAQLNFKV